MRQPFGFPELVIIFSIALFMFGPRLAPAVRQAAESRGYPLPLVVVFSLFLVAALLFGIVNTLELFK